MKKCSVVTIIGAANAGKSTLVNILVGSKVSIVTPKVQTTRNSLRGICMVDDTQLVLVDTPGIFKPKKTLEKAIVNQAWSNFDDADILLVMIDAKKGVCDDSKIIIEELKKRKLKAILVLNKVDSVRPANLLPLSKELDNIGVFEKIFMISALKDRGVNDLKKYLSENSPVGPWLFDEDQICDASIKFTVAEITRETLFMKLQNELPYSLTVETEKFVEDKKGNFTINQIIYVNKDNHKSIVLGKGGALIKDIGIVSRRKMQYMFENKVNLFLFVKVKEGWADNPNKYNQVGLEFNI